MTAWRTAASTQGAPLLVAFLVGPEQHTRLVEALPLWSIVTTAANGLGVRPSDVAAIAMMHGAIGIVLGGHSAGVQGVRALLVDLDTGGDGFPFLPHTSVPLLGVLCTDGTSAAYPNPLPWQLEVWRKVAALARARRIVACLTCTQMSYVESLPSPFMATRHVLAQALGVDLLPDVELHDGALHARGYPSPTGATTEAEAAHNRQLSQVFPAMLREHVFPFVGGGLERHDAAPAPATVRTGAKTPTGASLHRAILAAAERDLNVGVREDLGHNDGTVLRARYFPRFGLKPGANWCAAAGCDWMAQGEAETGRKSLVAGSPGAKAMKDQFIAAGAWVSAAAVRADHSLLEPGMAAVLDRSLPGRPETAWWGHFGIDVSIGEEVYWLIEGNSGERGEHVAIVERRLDDPRLLGFGRFER